MDIQQLTNKILSRTRKYRMWDVRNNEMRTDVTGFNRNGTVIIVFFEKGFEVFPVEDIILMETIGLTDKEGKDIYEGDIIRTDYEDGVIRGTVSVYNPVVFHAAAFCWVGETGGNCEAFEEWDSKSSAVAGNIFQHPELLDLNQTEEQE